MIYEAFFDGKRFVVDSRKNHNLSYKIQGMLYRPEPDQHGSILWFKKLVREWNREKERGERERDREKGGGEREAKRRERRLSSSHLLWCTRTRVEPPL